MSVSAWQVPANVVTAVNRLWPDAGPRWAARAPAELANLCARFEATPLRVFPARYAFVVATHTRTGADLVMKSTPDLMAADQAKVAQALARLDLGPKIHNVVTSETGIWTVADRVTPGDALPNLTLGPDVLDGVTRLLRLLANQPAPCPNLPKLADWLRQRLLDDDLADLAPNRHPAPLAERAEALKVLDDLAKDPRNEGLCHGDLSGTNILLAGRGRLLAIDPRGFAGDATYDAAVLVAKASGYGISTEVIAQVAVTAGFDPDRTRAWGTVVLAARV